MAHCPVCRRHATALARRPDPEATRPGVRVWLVVHERSVCRLEGGYGLEWFGAANDPPANDLPALDRAA